MFNHLESLGTANIAVGGTATRRSKRNAKAGVIPCKHRLFMVC